MLYAILKYSLHLMFDGFANDVFNRIDRRGRAIFARFHDLHHLSLPKTASGSSSEFLIIVVVVLY